MSMQHFLMSPSEVYTIGSDTEELAEELYAKLEEIDKQVKSIKNDNDYRSKEGSDAIIAAAEAQYPMLSNGAKTVAKYGEFAKYASSTSQSTDEEIASNVSRKIGDMIR